MIDKTPIEIKLINDINFVLNLNEKKKKEILKLKRVIKKQQDLIKQYENKFRQIENNMEKSNIAYNKLNDIYILHQS
tara:strand:- start:1093 stop:1323 length:231 start_codon:yes stop_codon:yes gene_type:complete